MPRHDDASPAWPATPVALSLVPLLVLGATLVPVAPSASAHADTCDLSGAEANILLPSANPNRGSINEYLYILVTRDDPALSEVQGAHQDLDAHVEDLECHLVDGGYTVTAEDEGNVDQIEPTVTVRFYDHFGYDLDQTDCAPGHNGVVPDYTQYIAVVPCEGAPTNTDGFEPYSVEIDLDVSV